MAELDKAVVFDTKRFTRILLNEYLQWHRRVLMASVLVLVVLVFFYFQAVYANTGPDPFLNVFYLVPMFLSCALFSSVISSNIHHPLERYHYLTLPCSNLERFASKFFLTGPLFLVYAIFLYQVFKLFAPLLTRMTGGLDTEFVAMDELDPLHIVMVYFSVHLWFFLGGILFRNYAFIRTGLATVGLYLSILLVMVLSMKIVYFDHFVSLFSLQSEETIRRGIGFVLFQDQRLGYLYWAVLYLWILFISYRCLQDHEV